MKEFAIALTFIATCIAAIIVLFLPSALETQLMTIAAPTELNSLDFDTVQQLDASLEERVATLEAGFADLALKNENLIQRVSTLESLSTVSTVTNTSAVESAPTPKVPTNIDLDILSIDAKVTETNSVFWRYAWKLTIKNPSDNTIVIDAQIKFLDIGGFVVKDERVYNLIIPAAATQTFTDFSLIGVAVAGDVVSVSVETYLKTTMPAETTPTPEITPAPEDTPVISINATPQVDSVDEVYVVQVGDDIESIAEQFGVSVEDIVSVNELPNPDYVFVGQRLRIPTAAKSAAPTPTAASSNEPIAEGVTVSVVEGPADLLAEAVQIVNDTDLVVNLAGWVLDSEGGPNYTFGDLPLFAGSYIWLHTRSGEATSISIYWGRDSAAWGSGTRLRLRNPQGTEVSTFTIP